MKNIFTGQAYSYTQGFNVLDEIKAGLPATLSLAFGAGIIWLLTSILFGTVAAIKAGQLHRSSAHRRCRWSASRSRRSSSARC